MEELMQEVCKVWRPEWKGIFLARAVWENGVPRPSNIHSNISTSLFEGKRILIHSQILEDHTPLQSLKVYLLSSSAPGSVKRVPKGSATFWQCFSRLEIRDFCHRIGDHNPLHFEKPAIVPGLLILEKIAKSFPLAQKVRLSFHSPIYENEQIFLCFSSNTISGIVGKTLRFSLLFNERKLLDE